MTKNRIVSKAQFRIFLLILFPPCGCKQGGRKRKEDFTMKCLIIDVVHSAIAEELGKYMQVDTHMLPTQEELVKLIPDYEVLIMRVDPAINKEILDAAAKLNGSNQFNEALADILTNDLAAASKVLGDAQCQCKNYLKAIIAARQGKADAAKAALKIASEDKALAKRAENDIEFAKIR